MPSTYTLNNGIELIATGEQSGTWGDTTNTNLELLDTALDGQITVTLASAGSSGSPNSLPISDGTASNGRNRMVIFDDSSDLGATAYVQLTPNDAEKIIYVRNSLSGSRSILLFQGTYNASNDYEVPAGTTAVIFFDGAGSGAVAANVLSDLQVENLSVFGTAPTITLTDTDTGVDTELNAASSVGQFTLNIDKNNEGSSPRLVTQISGTEFFRINESGAVFNESSNDQDFRVESDDNTHMLFVDASTNGVGINTSAVDHPLEVLTTANDKGIVLKDGDNDLVIIQRENEQFGRIRLLDATSSRIDISARGDQGLRTISVPAVFNDGGGDNNFRVESDNNANMIFLDAGEDHVNIGTSSDRGGVLNVYGTGNPIAVIESESDGTVLSLRTTDTDANAGPNLELYRNATGASNDNLGSIIIKGTDASAQDQIYFSIGTQISAAGNGVEASTVYFQNAVSGTVRERITMSSSALVINQEGLDNDFRVESDSNDHMLFVNAGDNRVGINKSSPERLFHVGGESEFDGTIFIDKADGTALQVEGNSNNTGYINWEANGWTFYTNGPVEALRLGSSEMVVNEDSRDYDFRVESNSISNMLVVNGGDDRVDIGGTPSGYSSNRLNIYGPSVVPGGTNGNVAIYSTDSHQSDVGGSLMLGGRYTTGGLFYMFGGIQAVKRTGITGDSSGTLKLYYINSANGTVPFFIGNQDALVFNEDSNNVDFRVESDANSHAVFVDAGDEYCYIGRSNSSDSTAGYGTRFALNSAHANITTWGTGTHTNIQFRNVSTGAVGSIVTTASGTTYNTTSDRRLKDNIEPIADGTEKLMAMKPVTHTWKADSNTGETVHGFIAQEMMDVVPEAVSGDPDGEEMMSMDYGRITPVLVAALQDAHNKIGALEKRLAEMEAK